ncbi:MAG: hypothetical protein KBE09_04275 [Candidatus Pacebacteria bacterium]|nr:hypothetical protein [Candidatus Paceibacterota bacterium]
MDIRNAILTLLEGEQTWRDHFRDLVHTSLEVRPLSPATAAALEALVLLDNQYRVLTEPDLNAIAEALADAQQLEFVCTHLPDTTAAASRCMIA